MLPMTCHPAVIADADRLLRHCKNDLMWRNESFTAFGKTHTLERRVAWYGDPGLSYRYSGSNHATTGWTADLANLKSRVNEYFGTRCNFVLLMGYPDGGVGLGWHRDDERGLNGPIVTVSLGAARRLRYRETRTGPSHAVELEHGSALLMDRRWYHSVPKTTRSCGERISLSFREVSGG
ncbi:MAG: alpha-ketoglutarate-dependent dioxygenase AlkB [Proteobacteria bacterium]|nr:alpha-ketoglutarate-dependent dioxygenase AlkB [Pseudomonadota bacterium]